MCVVALGVSLAAQQQQPPFRSGASTVAVYTTVTDSTGRLVPDLKQEDFEVYDNGKLQPLTLFATETQPLSIIVMIDRSGSMKDSYNLVAAGAAEFIKRLLPADKARIGSFSTKIEVLPEEFTNDRRGSDRRAARRSRAGRADAAVERANVAMRDLGGQEAGRSCSSSPTASTVPATSRRTI